MRGPLLSSVILLSSLSTHAQELPADLAHVPAKAAGFVHIKVAELWKSAPFKMYRDILPKAGAEALAILEQRIVPSLSSIDCVTIVMLLPDPAQQQQDPDFATLFHLRTPLDRKKFISGLGEMVNGRYYVLRGGATLQILDDQTIMIGSGVSPAAFTERTKHSASFREALGRAAAGEKAIVGALNPSVIPQQALAGLPPLAQPFARAKTVLFSLDLGKTVALEVDLGFADETQSKDAEQTLQQLRKLARAFLGKMRGDMLEKLKAGDGFVPLYDIEQVGELVGPVFALAMMKRGEEVLDGIPVARVQQHVHCTVTLPEELSSYASSGPVLVALLLPAVQKVRAAASRTQDSNNLKQLALAMHIHHDIYRTLPAPAICDKNGQPLLSWRVAILPFIEQQDLYQQFKLNEPWDSAHNKKLLDKMPRIFQLPGALDSPSQTYYRVFVGPDGAKSALYRTSSDKVSFAKVQDGTSNTLMIVESQDAVPWTKPDELIYDPNRPLPAFNRMRPGFNAALCDGSVRFLSQAVPEATLRALITRNGGETISLDE